MKSLKVLLVFVLCGVLIAPVAMAKDIWELATSDLYKEKTGGMLGRGIVNAATSPVDIVVQTVQRTKNETPLLGTLHGLGTGLGCTFLRASSGILDVALFWVPNFNGFAVSKSYENCLDEYEAEETIKAPVATNYYYAPSDTSVVATPVVPSAEENVVMAEPLITISEAPVQPPAKKAAKKHSPYDYVKK